MRLLHRFFAFYLSAALVLGGAAPSYAADPTCVGGGSRAGTCEALGTATDTILALDFDRQTNCITGFESQCWLDNGLDLNSNASVADEKVTGKGFTVTSVGGAGSGSGFFQGKGGIGGTGPGYTGSALSNATHFRSRWQIRLSKAQVSNDISPHSGGMAHSQGSNGCGVGGTFDFTPMGPYHYTSGGCAPTGQSINVGFPAGGLAPNMNLHLLPLRNNVWMWFEVEMKMDTNCTDGADSGSIAGDSYDECNGIERVWMGTGTGAGTLISERTNLNFGGFVQGAKFIDVNESRAYEHPGTCPWQPTYDFDSWLVQASTGTITNPIGPPATANASGTPDMTSPYPIRTCYEGWGGQRFNDDYSAGGGSWGLFAHAGNWRQPVANFNLASDTETGNTFTVANNTLETGMTIVFPASNGAPINGRTVTVNSPTSITISGAAVTVRKYSYIVEKVVSLSPALAAQTGNFQNTATLAWVVPNGTGYEKYCVSASSECEAQPAAYNNALTVTLPGSTSRPTGGGVFYDDVSGSPFYDATNLAKGRFHRGRVIFGGSNTYTNPAAFFMFGNGGSGPAGTFCGKAFDTDHSVDETPRYVALTVTPSGYLGIVQKNSANGLTPPQHLVPIITYTSSFQILPLVEYDIQFRLGNDNTMTAWARRTDSQSTHQLIFDHVPMLNGLDTGPGSTYKAVNLSKIVVGIGERCGSDTFVYQEDDTQVGGMSFIDCEGWNPDSCPFGITTGKKRAFRGRRGGRR